MTGAHRDLADDTEDDDLDNAGGELDAPMVVIIGRTWLVVGAVAVLGSFLARSPAVAVFGALCVVAGAVMLFLQSTRTRLATEERTVRRDPGDPEPGASADDQRGAEPGDGGSGDHPTRAMPTDGTDERGPSDEVVDVEWYPYDIAPADQDDGTGYDDEVDPWYDEPTAAVDVDHRHPDDDAPSDSSSSDGSSSGTGSSGTSSSGGDGGTSGTGDRSSEPDDAPRSGAGTGRGARSSGDDR